MRAMVRLVSVSALALLACRDAPTDPSTEDRSSVLDLGAVRLDALAAAVAPAANGESEVRVAVRVTNRDAVEQSVPLAYGTSSGRGCGSLALHRTAGRVGTPVWRQEHWVAQLPVTVVCQGALPVYVLAPQASVAVPLSVPVGAILGDSLPSGRYFARVTLYVEPGRQLPGRYVTLDAGSVELRRR